MTKVDKSDGEATFAGTRGNDGAAPKAVVALALHTCEDSTDCGYLCAHLVGVRANEDAGPVCSA
jgi:hypothetical protein